MKTRFVVISDTHFAKKSADIGGAWWNRTTERYSEEMGEALVTCMRDLSPDFVIHCGDFAGGDSQENVELGLSVMDRLGCPWYGVPGNHDSRSKAARDMFMQRFTSKTDSWSYTRDLGGIRFFFLDVVQWIGSDGSRSPLLDTHEYDSGNITGMGPTPSDIAWLDRELGITPLPAVIVTHAPVHFKEAYPLAKLPYGKPVESPLTKPESFVSGFVRPDEGRGRLLDIVRQHENVAACLAGHWHINDALNDEGRLFLQTAALREYPYEIRLIEFDGASFDVSTHPLDLPELRVLSYIVEWGNEWVRGDESVRNFRFSPGNENT